MRMPGGKKKPLTRFVCELCDEDAFARPSAFLLCGNCKWPMFADDGASTGSNDHG